MKSKSYIMFFLLCAVVSLYGYPRCAWEEIEIEAGKPQTLCLDGEVAMADLHAGISGLVDDGHWFTSGDGQFLPSNRFSEATTYIPGTQDKANGSFFFTLVSDDPDGPGPKVQVNDVVQLEFMDTPVLLCSGNLNIPLNEVCNLELKPIHVLSNPIPPYDKYTFHIRDENNNIIPDNRITIDHVGQTLHYTVSHDCTESTCSGTVSVVDNIPPKLFPKDTLVSCYTPFFVPDSLNFPVPSHAKITKLDSVTYHADSINACGRVTLRYRDEIERFDCPKNNINIIEKITRTWTAMDIHGNSSTGQQIIQVYAEGLDTIVFPPNFDNTDSLSFGCNDSWPALASGIPSPDTTGVPAIYACQNISVNFSDTKIDACGAGFKVLRKWHLIDWCTNKDTFHNQVILVEDKEGPLFRCLDTIRFQTEPYACSVIRRYVPEPSDVQDCSEDWSYTIHLRDSLDNDITTQYVSGKQLDDLPVGKYKLEYRLRDVCGNVSTCLVPVYIEDTYAPYVNCISNTTASITNEGSVRVYVDQIDNGSHDNCGIIHREVARMIENDTLAYGDYVEFSCADVGETVMVSFRATDASANSNVCMVEVRIDDKVKPKLVCPDDITISCTTNWNPDNLSNFGSIVPDSIARDSIIVDGVYKGRGGYYSDNCGVTITETDSVKIHCGAGYIYRYFKVVDAHGNADSCTQTITVKNDRPFIADYIQWPRDTTIVGCDSLAAVDSITGRPILSTESCGLAESTYSDQIFLIEAGACIKVLRSWTVIDWCTYTAGSDKGIWKHTQTIKLINTVAPELQMCQDTTICSTSENCERSLVTLHAQATDDCTPADRLRYTWALDIDNDGSYDDFGQGSIFEKVLNYGTYTIKWRAEDGCGNASFCEQKFTTTNCKKPTPYCITDVSTVIMPSSKELRIWAKNFNLNSVDNCTPQEELIYSFSSDTSDTSKLITCADIENGIAGYLDLQMWVTDSEGHQDFCTVQLYVADNDDVCPDNPGFVHIKGQVKTIKGTPLDSIEVVLTSSSGEKSKVVTDVEGQYAFSPVAIDRQYHVLPAIESDRNLGVNSRDLLTIIRHILKKDTLESVFDSLAADVDNDGHITAIDLLEIRKSILYKDYQFKSGTGGWSFVARHTDFTKLPSKFSVSEGILVEEQNPIANFDVVAIKIGDVNRSVDSRLQYVKKRRTKTLSVIAQKEGSGYALYLPKGHTIEAFQLALHSSDVMDVSSEQLSAEDIVQTENEVRMLHLLDGYNPQKPFCYIQTYGTLDLVQNFSSQIYTVDEDYTIDIEIRDSEPVSYDATLHPNPFANSVYVQEGSGVKIATIDIYTLYGDKVLTYHEAPSVLDVSPLPVGVYYFVVTYQNGKQEQHKMIKAH